MQEADALLYRIALTLIPGVGDATARKLIRLLPDIQQLFCEKPATLRKIPGLPYKVINEVSTEQLRRAEKEISFLINQGARAHFITDPTYPRRLKDIDDAPVLLYTLGEADLNPFRTIGIVGTRNAGAYGKEIVKELIRDLLPYDPVIVSGLALGIDGCAHEASLENGLSTIGIPGHGLDRIYPYRHREIARKMVENRGGLATEFLSGTKPDKENFPKRNRIIAALSDSVVVVEAGEKGGALITARIAFSYHKEVYAFPGRITDTYSKGCNMLIKQNIAAAVESANDIAWNMGWSDEIKTVKTPVEASLFTDLAPEELTIVEHLKSRKPISLDHICIESSLPVHRASSILLNLEFQGLIKSLPGKRYQLNL